jgi:uncharacterized protein (TIGR03034 family)
MWAGVIEIADAGQNFMSDGAEAGAGVAEQSASAPVAAASGFQPTQLAGAAMPGGLASGFQPSGLPNLQPATLLDGIQLPQIPKMPQIPKPLSFIEKIKKAAETILQKIASLFQGGSDIRSSAAADNRANNKGIEFKAKAESDAKSRKEEAESSKIIINVEGKTEAFSGQEVIYEATVRNKDGIVKDCSDVRWAIKADGKELKENDIKKDNDIRIEKDKITIKIKDAWAGKEIIVMPYLNSNSPKESMSVRTKVDKLELPITIAESDRKRGKEADGITEARDMHCGDLAIRDIFIIFREYARNPNYTSHTKKLGNADLQFQEFKTMAKDLFAMNRIKLYEYKFPEDLSEECYKVMEVHRVNLESNIISMIDHFRNGEGMDYSSSDLTDAVMNHEDTIRFFNQIRRGLAGKLKTHEGNIFKIEEDKIKIDPLNENIIKQPQYSTWTDKFEGLSIAINDTWAYEVQVTEYQEKNGNYEGKIKIFIYDHFGLDNDDVDINKPAHYFPGFFHWFALQRWDGFNKKYKPFVTVIEKELPFKGNWKS